jgi:imidazolonepropionase-like amidohydrolase
MIRLRSLAITMAVVPAVASVQYPAAWPPVSEVPAEVTAFVDVAVIPMDSERILANQTVLVQNGRITALGPAAQVRVPEGTVRIDGRGQFLIPGLADMHAHLGLTTLDIATAERWLLLYALEGVTTIRNTDYRHGNDGLTGPGLLRLQARAAAGELLSPRIYTSGPWGPKRYISVVKDAPAPRLDSVAAYIAAYKAAGYDFIKVHDETTVIHDSVAAAARRVGIPVAGHMPGHSGRKMALERFQQTLTGMRSVEHLSGSRGTLTTWSDSGGRCPIADSSRGLAGSHPACVLEGVRFLAEVTQRAGTWSVPTLVLKGDGININGQHVKALQDAGAGLLLGTDAIPDSRGSPGQVHQELNALVRAGLTPYQALAAGTRNVAQYFGTLDSSGTVAVGKRADLVLLYGNPLADVRHTREPAGVMIKGRWLDRVALDQRLLALPASTTWLKFDLPGDPAASKEQRTQFATYVKNAVILADSLKMTPPSEKSSSERLRRRLTDELGAARTILTPKQRVAFDPKVRIWIRTQARQGYQVVVSGVTATP